MSVEFNEPTRAAVTVAEMARMVGLSRARFDGKPVLFYARGNGAPLPSSKPRPKKAVVKKDEQFGDLVAGLKSLGLTAVNAEEVRSAVAVVFPNGITGLDGGQVIRAVFLHLKRRDSGDKVG
jgi:hypothetical protein